VPSFYHHRNKTGYSKLGYIYTVEI
jgi:hypothetical protein